MGRGLLILVSGFVLIVGLVQKSILDSLEYLPERTTEYHQEMTAQNISSSFMEYAITELDNDQDWDNGFSSNDYMGAEVDLYVFDYDDFTSGLPPIAQNNSIQNWDEYTILLVSRTKTEHAIAITEAGITKDAFSRYTYFTDEEPNSIRFYDADVFDGPVHTNDTMRIAGNPTFRGEVTSPYQWIGDDQNSHPKLLDDHNFHAKKREMPSEKNLDHLKNKGLTNGLRFDNQEVWVEFKNDGTVDIKTRNTGSSLGDEENWSSPQNYDLQNTNGVISSSEKVFTKGTVKGQATLHSEKNVEIMGDIYYNTDPSQDSTSTDLLGIVSEEEVIVDYGAETDHGTKDLEINASIMALGKSFKVEGHDYGSPKGTLKLNGGIQQIMRGPVGMFNQYGISSGFSKEYSYDDRLARLIPPFYPRESVYSKLYWRERPLEYL
ncbi:DUF4900 domain-containing protein [Fodinibius halophilus]|uniref:DUF4900 domain-containing protein n=1 Tax=Fodinibius halophilus TaxID=1736908 RepID=A0A6M1TC65_9BACT|nr:DUF4900 domain-containing protein [Fodinibius halophilus]NGP87822.1 DUF4900 domain-containing protein [Fodinibius halophilus]